MEFYFLKASRSMVAASALALLTGLVFVPVAAAQDTGTQQAAAAGQTAKNWKDRAEYDLYVKISQTTDPKAKLELLNTWQDKYPQSDYSQERLMFFVNTLGQLAASDPTQRQPLINKCEELLKADPKNFTADYYMSIFGPQLGGANPPADLLTQIQAAAHGLLEGAETTFAPDKKKPNMTDAQWTQAKNLVLAVGHNTLAWAAEVSKDNATAESEYKASLTANPNQGRVSAAYGKLLIEEKKYPEGLFEYARAAQYDGQDAVPAANRQQLMDYFKKAYSDYHGGPDGSDQILAQAKTDALPPAGLSVTSAADIANKQADAMNTRIASDPGFKIWYAIKSNLQDKGDAFFNSDVKGAEIPGDAVPSKTFTGTVISMDPPDKPTKVILGVEDPTKPDATLVFSQPLPAEALTKIQVGQKLDFSGVADSYNKDPYMLTFTDPTIPGVQTSAPPKKGTTKRRRPPASK